MSPQPTPRWSASFLAAIAAAAVPGLDVVATRHPRYVTDEVEVTGVLDSTGRTWVVRAPRDAATSAALAAEAALLAELADAGLPFAVARPVGSAELADGTRAVVSHDLPGRPLHLAALKPGPGLAASLGSALAALHECGWDAADRAGLPVYDAESIRVRLLAELDAMAETGRVPTLLLRRWERALEDVAQWRFRPGLVHGDPSGERVMVDGDAVVALEDFSHAHVGDPAVDLAWLVAGAPEDGLESVLEAYSVGRVASGDAGVVWRAQLHSELALGRWLLHGVRGGDVAVAREAQEMLDDLADALSQDGEDGEDEPTS